MTPRATRAITVITPSLPDRAAMLAEAVASVEAQTLSAEAHLIEVDHLRDGPAILRNRMLERAATEWVAFLDDDDLLDPHHLETLAAGSADVVVPYCRFDGPPLSPLYVNQPYSRKRLARHGLFPPAVLARTSAVLRAGGSARRTGTRTGPCGIGWPMTAPPSR